MNSQIAQCSIVALRESEFLGRGAAGHRRCGSRRRTRRARLRAGEREEHREPSSSGSCPACGAGSCGRICDDRAISQPMSSTSSPPPVLPTPRRAYELCADAGGGHRTGAAAPTQRRRRSRGRSHRSNASPRVRGPDIFTRSRTGSGAGGEAFRRGAQRDKDGTRT